MKLIKVKRFYTGDDKKEHYSWNFYIELDNGSQIAIKPAFKEDTRVLSFFAQEII